MTAAQVRTAAVTLAASFGLSVLLAAAVVLAHARSAG